MSVVRRNNFEAQYANKTLNLDKAQNDPQQKALLEKAGIGVKQLRGADVDNDGQIDAAEAFALADSFALSSEKGAISVNDNGTQNTPAGKALSTLGLLLKNKDDITGASPAKSANLVNIDLVQIEARFDRAAEQIRKNPDSVFDLKDEFNSIKAELDPGIELDQNELAYLQTQLAAKESQLGLIKKHIGIFSPKDVSELRDQIDTIEDRLSTSKAFRAGAQLALRIGQEKDAEMNPSTWRKRISSAAARISHQEGATAKRQSAVGGLVSEQDKFGDVVDRCHLDKNAINTAVEDFSQEVAWHQRWKWVDVVIGGESERGALFRAGKEMNTSTGALLSELESVRTYGEDRTQSELSELLKLESPEYLSMRTEYDKLKPAYQGLNSVLRATKDAKSNLKNAEYWIDRRNYLSLTEPTKYETVKEPIYKYVDGKRVLTGYDNKQQETYAHRSWQGDYDSAASNARWSSSSAETNVSHVNRQLPSLEQALIKIDSMGTGLGTVDRDISSFWGELSSLGVWSYDSSQVDKMQAQMNRLEGQLTQIKSQVEPRYFKHEHYVNDAIAKRRQELRTIVD